MTNQLPSTSHIFAMTNRLQSRTQNLCNPRRAHLLSVILEHPYLQQPATLDTKISMASSSSSLSKWEKQFVGEPITELPDDHLPTLGEIFRLLHHHRLQSSRRTESHRNNALLCSTKCIEVWKKFGIPTALEHNVTRKLVKLLKLFKSVHCQSGKARKRNEILWRRKLQLVFNVAARNAVKKCRAKKRQMLQTLEKEAKELEDFERNLREKKTLEDSEMSPAPIVNEVVKEHESLKKKAESTENAEHAMKRCKVVLSRMRAATVLGKILTCIYFSFSKKFDSI